MRHALALLLLVAIAGSVIFPAPAGPRRLPIPAKAPSF